MRPASRLPSALIWAFSSCRMTPVYRVEVFSGGFQIEVFIHSPPHLLGEVGAVPGRQFFQRLYRLHRQMEGLALCLYRFLLQIKPPFTKMDIKRRRR